MKWFKRIALFMVVNILVTLTLSIVTTIICSVLGIQLSSGATAGTMVLCLVWGMGGAFISLLMSKFMVKRWHGVQIIDPNATEAKYRDVVTMVYDLSKKAGLTKMPEVGIFESPEINAFATGPSRNNSLVALSTGLLSSMSRDEVEGVIGHEIAHIANGDMVTMTLIQGIVNAFAMFLARAVAQIIASNMDEKMSRIVYHLLIIVLEVVFLILGSLVVNYFSRRREFRADAGGARFAGRGKMISGLKKLQAQYAYIVPDNGATATLKISAKSSGIMAWFSTHPPLEERIRRLEQST